MATRTAAAPKHGSRAVLTTHRLRAFGLLAALGLLAVAAGLSLAVGTRTIPLSEVIQALTDSQDTDDHVIVNELRVPRTVIGLLAGAGLGAAGALMQGVTRNPLADPEILGINAGASFAVVLCIYAFNISSIGIYTWFALAGAGLTAVAGYVLGMSGRDGATPIKLALAGAVLAVLFSALTSAVLVLDASTLDEFRFWVVGSIAGRESGVAASVAPFVVVGLIIALAAGRWLNALALGDDVARSLGQNVARARLGASVGFVLLAGAAVAAAGPIGFVGLVVPHVARALCGPDYRWIVPYSIVLGPALLLGSDVLGRIMARPAELEVGIVTALIGAPFFIWLVRRRRLAEL